MASVGIVATPDGGLAGRSGGQVIVALPIPKPQRRRGWLHRLVDHRQHLGRERVQVNLIAQASAERRDRLSCDVLAPVEAPIHHRLDMAGRMPVRVAGVVIVSSSGHHLRPPQTT
jgi:hypothetical protein